MTVQQVHVWAIADANNDDVRFFFPEETNGPFFSPACRLSGYNNDCVLFSFSLDIVYMACDDILLRVRRPFWYFSFSSLWSDDIFYCVILYATAKAACVWLRFLSSCLRWKPLWASASSLALLSPCELWHLYTRTPFVIWEHCLSILHSLFGVFVCWGG